MPLTGSAKRELRARAHSLQPVVQTGNKGLTDAVIAEIDIALATHELIKVRLAGMEREARKLAAPELARQTDAELIGEIGTIVILFRKRPEKPRPTTLPSSAPAGRGAPRRAAPATTGARPGREGERSQSRGQDRGQDRGQGRPSGPWSSAGPGRGGRDTRPGGGRSGARTTRGPRG